MECIKPSGESDKNNYGNKELLDILGLGSLFIPPNLPNVYLKAYLSFIKSISEKENMKSLYFNKNSKKGLNFLISGKQENIIDFISINGVSIKIFYSDMTDISDKWQKISINHHL